MKSYILQTNDPDDMDELAERWINAKWKEVAATTERREIEDRIRFLVRVAENLDGTKTVDSDFFSIKIVGRIERKVDSDKLQELAAEAGLTEHISRLFRWKPEVSISEWKAADESITRPLAAAITAKPGRPSFQIINKINQEK